MTPEIYRLLHVVGVLLLFLGLGGVLASEPGKSPKLAAALHGIGLLTMIVAGVGLMHRSSPVIGWEPWVFAKIGGWLLLGAMPTLIKKGVLPRFFALLLVVAIGAAGAWLGLAQPKPF
jgi:hypothetical protein